MESGWLIDGPEDAAWTLILAHGAGAPMDHAFMNDISCGLAGRGIRVVRFEFPYMVQRRTEGNRRPPDRPPRLLQAYREVIEAIQAPRLAIGGKSMGGRIASMIAADASCADALICLGYPFHPPGKPDRLRIDHLRRLEIPTLVVQGTRDPFGGPDEVSGYELPAVVRFRWLADGDHGFRPRKASGHTLEEHINTAVDAVEEFLGDGLHCEGANG